MRGFERVAAKLGMPNHSSATGQQKVDFVKQTLSDWSDSWLLVFDNCDSPTDIESFFPFGKEEQKSAILVTSRKLLIIVWERVSRLKHYRTKRESNYSSLAALPLR
jgi:hypothetical protein